MLIGGYASHRSHRKNGGMTTIYDILAYVGLWQKRQTHCLRIRRSEVQILTGAPPKTLIPQAIAGFLFCARARKNPHGPQDGPQETTQHFPGRFQTFPQTPVRGQKSGPGEFPIRRPPGRAADPVPRRIFFGQALCSLSKTCYTNNISTFRGGLCPPRDDETQSRTPQSVRSRIAQ